MTAVVVLVSAAVAYVWAWRKRKREVNPLCRALFTYLLRLLAVTFVIALATEVWDKLPDSGPSSDLDGRAYRFGG